MSGSVKDDSVTIEERFVWIEEDSRTVGRRSASMLTT
jgi:hypothetical protein